VSIGPEGVIRPARAEDLPALRDLEIAAGASFRELGMADVADDDPPTVADLAAYQEGGRAWVVADAADHPVAYLLVQVLDGSAHIDQVSVHPSLARQGLGRRLLDTVAAWAAQRGLSALTLTTFANVPWNAPYYERLGFRVLSADQTTSGLRRVQDHEARHGLAQWPRVAMWRAIGDEHPRR
jgi:GNAT superfamily N-acetyltransferase